MRNMIDRLRVLAITAAPTVALLLTIAPRFRG